MTLFEDKQLGNVLDFYDHQRIPLNSIERVTRQGGYRYYGAQGVIDYIDSYIYDGEFILIAEDGANLVTRNEPIAFLVDGQFWVNNHAHVVKGKEGQVNDYYLTALLNNLNIAGHITGAAQPKLSQQNLKAIKVSLPSYRLQCEIAELLSSYDILIENNRRRIELLEQSARLLYQEWFVRLRFPSYEHSRIVDGVPEGWFTKKLVEVADITMGQSPKSKFYNENECGLPFHQGVTNYGNRFVEHKIFCTQSARLAEPYDILCSVRAPVGRLNITLDKIAIGRGISAIREINGNQSFLFYALKNYFFKEDIIGSGSIYASVTKNDMENVLILYPTQLLIEQFEDITNSIDDQIVNLSRQIKRLTLARDLLLPRLMSGELAV